MAKYYFNLKKYEQSLENAKISPNLRRYFMEVDKKLQGKEVKFKSRKATWGFVDNNGGVANRDWCIKEKTRFRDYVEKIKDRLNDLTAE